jgi:hypothetical protein
MTDSFKVEVTARIKSITPRTNWRASMHQCSCNEALPELSEILQTATSITWATVTGEQGGKRQGATNYEIPVWLAVWLETYLRGRYWD